MMVERIRRAGVVCWALCGVAAVIVVLGIVAWVLRVIWPPLILAGAIVFLLNPVVTHLQRRHIPRALGTAFSYLAVAAVMAIGQQIDNHFISPIVMQRAVKLHPAVVMLALLAGGTLGGFFGLLLAVPATAVLKITLGHAWRHLVLGQPLDEIEALWEADDAQPGVGIVETIGHDVPLAGVLADASEFGVIEGELGAPDAAGPDAGA